MAQKSVRYYETQEERRHKCEQSGFKRIVHGAQNLHITHEAYAGERQKPSLIIGQRDSNDILIGYDEIEIRFCPFCGVDLEEQFRRERATVGDTKE